jgi:hypothetical protein|nr:MAG TPA: hypothetical protein [Bacteriophage sp.]
MKDIKDEEILITTEAEEPKQEEVPPEGKETIKING